MQFHAVSSMSLPLLENVCGIPVFLNSACVAWFYFDHDDIIKSIISSPCMLTWVLIKEGSPTERNQGNMKGLWLEIPELG